MGLPKLLTEQQKKFCELLVYNEGRKTPTECAKEAGYAEGSCHVRASELRNPNKFPLVVKSGRRSKKNMKSRLKDTLQSLAVYAKKLWLRALSLLQQTLKLLEVKLQDYISNKK